VNLDDFRKQIIQLKQLGSLRGLVRQRRRVIEGSMGPDDFDADAAIARVLAIIDSMTAQERLYPILLTVPRRCLRIALGAGVKPAEVSGFFAQFKAMRDAKLPF
jgi:signal recognition particle subunit SRP54